MLEIGKERVKGEAQDALLAEAAGQFDEAALIEEAMGE
jgi:hypothetical protein